MKISRSSEKLCKGFQNQIDWRHESGSAIGAWAGPGRMSWTAERQRPKLRAARRAVANATQASASSKSSRKPYLKWMINYTMLLHVNPSNCPTPFFSVEECFRSCGSPNFLREFFSFSSFLPRNQEDLNRTYKKYFTSATVSQVGRVASRPEKNVWHKNPASLQKVIRTECTKFM